MNKFSWFYLTFLLIENLLLVFKKFIFYDYYLIGFYLISVVGQRTIPAELPINGDPTTEINLELIFAKGNPTFALNGKTLQLLHPLDRDEENLSHIVFQVFHFYLFLISLI